MDSENLSLLIRLSVSGGQKTDSSKVVSVIGTAISLVIVAGLWGATNPFIKRGSKGIEKVKSSSAVGQFFAELWFLATNWKYLLPFLVNQSGSIVYYITLASAELSLAVPITNSLTFIFTSISGKLLGEKSPSRTTLIGMGLVIVGVLLCVMDKV